ncbi:luciferin 4-monooxygenase-like isoform X2 [Hyposmocoma kahamanoa]|uniref:luciferin 4-monooxygenase-like isoform X2 n=1 Tax=Hyposmocoma kahamanoa TaxID=1477025 RepID=UPI000E6D88C7|nr:luciferin 4-monooxygenase-like isoform X2 [Hyposmocoma kahamanoa]
MYPQRGWNDAVHLYMNELSARVIAETGIPSDRYHLGKLILRGLQDAPDFVLQIDAATGESETCESVLKRSVQCANALRNLGLQRGDVIVLMAPNHIHLCVPYYAGLYLGITVALIDRTLTVKELQHVFVVDNPKIIFCQSERAAEVVALTKTINLNTQIVTFDDGADVENVCSFNELLKHSENDCNVNNFRATDFDPEETLAFLVPTSGTSGLPKQAAASHRSIAIGGPYAWMMFTKFPTPTRLVMIISPIQWTSAILHFNLSPILRYTRLQSSANIHQEHAYEMINKYKPTIVQSSPTFMTTLLRPGDRDKCDFSSFEEIGLGGSHVPVHLVNEIKLVDPETLENITDPNVNGELWLKGPCLVKGYYGNPTATKEAFTEDGWYRTGDIFYRDEHYNFYFSEKLKLLLKYKNHQVSPTELENVIRQNPGVSDVAVTGIPDPEYGELIVACVVRKPGHEVTAQEIKDLVKNNLAETKHLSGGVIFIKELPLTASGKIHRQAIKKLVLELGRE